MTQFSGLDVDSVLNANNTIDFRCPEKCPQEKIHTRKITPRKSPPIKLFPEN